MRSARALLIALVVVVLGMGLTAWRRAGRSALGEASATGAPGLVLDSPPPTTHPAPRTLALAPTSAAVEPADSELGPDELAAELGDPRRSDLPYEDAVALSALGVAVVRADVTGVGRDRYPAYFGAAAARLCCTELSVVAAGARRHQRRADRADVTVVWTARARDLAPSGRRLSRVMFIRGPGGWEPVHPWEVADE